MNESTREALRELLGSSVVEVHDLRYESVARKVWRVRTAGRAESVIVKEAIEGADDADVAWRHIRRDGRSLQAAASSGAVPNVLALDDDHRILVMEDLGPRPSLADVLLGEDPDAAARGIVELARALGRVHAATRGHAAGGDELLIAANLVDRGRALVSALRDQFGTDAGDDVLVELDRVQQAIAHPGPHRALVHGDPCPDNNVVRDDGSIVLFDFEYGGGSHAYLDVAYLHLPFPSCWCANAIPERVVAEADAAYIDAAGVGSGAHAVALATAAVAWCITSIAWDVDRFGGEDRTWGIAPTRPRHVHRLRTARRLCEQAAEWDAFVAFTHAAEAAFVGRWPEAAVGLPQYPAFR